MAITFKLPELGESIEGGTVSAIRVAVGDSVEKDQTLVELETDKAVVEVPSPAAGVIKELNATEGGEIKVGDVIAVIDDSGDGKASPPKAKEEKKAPAEKKKAAPKKEPELEETEAEEEPEPEEPEEEEEPEPGEEEEPEEEKAAPKSKERVSATEEKSEDTDDEAPQTEPEQTESDATAEDGGRRVAAAPSVRRFAREIGIDINQVSPNQPHGRLSKEDIKKYSKRKNTGGVSAPAPKAGGIPTLTLPNFEKFGPIRREKMSKVREKTAERMAIAWATIPHVTQHDKADITKLEEFRKQYGKRAEEEGGKLTPTAILVKVLAAALKEFPEINASIDVANQEVVYKEYCNIGVAVDTPRGLLVPVIKDADEKSLIDIAVELSGMAERARDAKTKLEELQGACITVTNLGGIGGTSFTPIVNAPEVAILGVSRARMEPVWMDGQFEPRLMMPLSLSYDHRLVDGANAARVTRWLCEAVENPFLMLLDS